MCIDPSEDCPINYLDIMRQDRRRFVDKHIDLGSNLLIAYSGNFEPDLPITQFKLELVKPCIHTFF